MPIRAVVFDFDGVIANTEPLHYRGYRDVLADIGIELTEADYYASYLGYDDVGAFAAIAADRGRALDTGAMVELVERKAMRIEELERESPVLFPGAAEAVQRLASAYPLAIASGALRAEIVRVLAASGLEPFFQGIVAAEDTPSSKPAPDPYLEAVGVLRRARADDALAAGSCVAIEDSVWGLRSARAAGLRTIAVTHTYPADALRDVSDLVIPSLDVLDPLLLVQTFG